jgi:hypothetical protein
MEPAGSGATWTGSPKGVFAGGKHHKPRQGVVANTMTLQSSGAVGFIDWLDGLRLHVRDAHLLERRAAIVNTDRRISMAIHTPN